MYNQVHLIYSTSRGEWRSTRRGFNGSLARPNRHRESNSKQGPVAPTEALNVTNNAT